MFEEENGQCRHKNNSTYFYFNSIRLLFEKTGILRSGDGRVLNAYVYYFALPALFFVDLAETDFTHKNLRFIVAGILPILAILAIYIFLYVIFKFSKKMLYLLILSSVFGSLAFFGIPFMMFAFPSEEHLATISASTISVVGVTISITILELYNLRDPR